MRGNLTNIRMAVFSQTTVHLSKYPANSKSFGKIIGMGAEDNDASQDYFLKWQPFTEWWVPFCVGLWRELEHWTVKCPQCLSVSMPWGMVLAQANSVFEIVLRHCSGCILCQGLFPLAEWSRLHQVWLQFSAAFPLPLVRHTELPSYCAAAYALNPLSFTQ